MLCVLCKASAGHGRAGVYRFEHVLQLPVMQRVSVASGVLRVQNGRKWSTPSTGAETHESAAGESEAARSNV